jgi:phosphonate transport system ATP-binding protein
LAIGGQSILNKISLEIKTGEVVALVGPSGAGKTSLLRIFNGMLQPTKGEVRVDDQCLASLTRGELRGLRSQIGFVPQDLGLVPNLRVAQNVITGRIGRMSSLRALRTVIHQRPEELQTIHSLLEGLGIGEKLFQRVDSLSGGEQQRVAIARALYQEPGALLADEPLSALDPARAREILKLLIEIARIHNLTLVLSLHDIVLARELVPRLVGLRAGRILFDRATAEVTDGEIQELYGLELKSTSDDS